MADTHDTIADIIAWLRKPMEGENAYLTLWRDEIADRLDAAHRRELSKNASKNGADFGQLGDAAKLRVALETLRELLGDLLRLGDAEYHNDFSNFCDIIDAALAAPPRNCDRFATADEAIGAYRQTHKHMVVNVFLDWLLAPATEKEGGAK